MPGRAGTTRRKDGNHDEVVEALQKLPLEVWSTAALGNGFPDLVVYFRGVLTLLEVKMPGEKLTEKEAKFAARWPVSVVYSGEEAVNVVVEAARPQ